MKLLLFFILVAPQALWSKPARPRSVSVDYSFERKNFDLEWSLHSVSAKLTHEVGKTISKKQLTPDEIGKALTSPFQIRTTDAHLFALKISNKSKETKYFMVTPHLVEPIEASIDYYFECLCNHHVYEIPPQSEWMRILRLNLGKKFRADKIKIIHHLIGLSEQEVQTNYKDRIYK